MKVDLRPAHRNAPRPPEKDAPGFLQWIRGRPCLFADSGKCDGKRQSCHLDFAGKVDGVDPALGKGTSSKVADRYAVPMCAYHHRLQHDKGWPAFMALMGVTREMLMLAAARLWNAWPGRPAWERKQAA